MCYYVYFMMNAYRWMKQLEQSKFTAWVIYSNNSSLCFYIVFNWTQTSQGV